MEASIIFDLDSDSDAEEAYKSEQETNIDDASLDIGSGQRDASCKLRTWTEAEPDAFPVSLSHGASKGVLDTKTEASKEVTARDMLPNSAPGLPVYAKPDASIPRISVSRLDGYPDGQNLTAANRSSLSMGSSELKTHLSEDEIGNDSETESDGGDILHSDSDNMEEATMIGNLQNNHDTKSISENTIMTNTETLHSNDLDLHPDTIKGLSLSNDSSLFPERLPTELSNLIEQWCRGRNTRYYPCATTSPLINWIRTATKENIVWKFPTEENPEGEVLGARLYTMDGKLLSTDKIGVKRIVVVRNHNYGPFIVRFNRCANNTYNRVYYKVWVGLKGDKEGFLSGRAVHKLRLFTYDLHQHQEQLRKRSATCAKPRNMHSASSEPSTKRARIDTIEVSSAQVDTNTQRLMKPKISLFSPESMGSSKNNRYDDAPDCSICGRATTKKTCIHRSTKNPVCRPCYNRHWHKGTHRQLSATVTNMRPDRSETPIKRHEKDTGRHSLSNITEAKDVDIATHDTNVGQRNSSRILRLRLDSKSSISQTSLRPRTARASPRWTTDSLSSPRITNVDTPRVTFKFIIPNSNQFMRQKTIAACNTIEKLFAHAIAGGAFPASAIAGSRILSVQAEARNDAAPMMVVEEDEDDFKALMDRIQQSDSNVTFEVRAIS
jgi:hypothetical protein